MKKGKVMGLIWGTAAAAIVLGAAGYRICEKKHTAEISQIGMGHEEYYELNELIGEAGSKEEAEEIAALYRIVLLEYQENIALFRTEEDPMEVIARGEKEGYPQLWLNDIRQGEQ